MVCVRDEEKGARLEGGEGARSSENQGVVGDGEENGAAGRVANKVFIVSRTDYKARLLPFFGIQIISRSSESRTSNLPLGQKFTAVGFTKWPLRS